MRTRAADRDKDAAASLPHFLAVAGGAACIAFAPIFAVQSVRLGGIGYFDAAFWRVFIGAIALGLILTIRGETRSTERTTAGSAGWILLPGIVFAGDFFVWHWSFEHTSVANSTLLANLSILWVTLFAGLVWGEVITRRFLWGAATAFGGMVLLMLSSANREPPAEGNAVFGDFLAVLTSLFYGAYQLLIKKYRRAKSAVVLLFWASLVASIFLLPMVLIHDDVFLPASAKAWLPLLGLGVLSHACGQGLIAYGLGGVPSSLAAVVLLLQPVLTAIFGLILLGQPLVPWQIAGAACVLFGLFLAIRGRIRSY